jgi:starch synthase
LERKFTISSSLSRFVLKDEHLVTDTLVKEAIARAFSENRCFDFVPDSEIIHSLKSLEYERFIEAFSDIKNDIIDRVSQEDQTLKNRLLDDARLNARIVTAIGLIHRAIAEENLLSMLQRRFVLIKEEPGTPTLYHISNDTTVISHVGQGPQWEEIPSLYLGLNIFDALQYEIKRGESTLFRAFRQLLMIEERAIETGYSHTEVFTPEVSRALNHLVDEVIGLSTLEEIDFRKVPARKKIIKFTPEQRKKYLRLLDSRLKGDVLNFDYEKNVKSIKSLERLARRYKKGTDVDSLREIVRILVAASGHDLHEVRNSANIILERIFSPKEFDAPLATRFINLRVGERFTFKFNLPEHSEYFVRLYRNWTSRKLFLERDISFVDIELLYERGDNSFLADHVFEEYGQYDFVVFEKKRNKLWWMTLAGTSGRINVIPDLEGEILLEIFPDIHGHTGVYWSDESAHPGLVYNENGEVIRLGRFSDISSHLDDLKRRYSITALYLLGVQKRGHNREDWAEGATSPSPFSPMSLFEIEPSLGGEEEFSELVEKAHQLGIKIIVDVVPHLNRLSKEVSDDHVVFCYDDGGSLVVRGSTDGRFGSWNDGKLLNYRNFEVWEWLCESILTLIERYDIDGVRFDSAHAVPIMMKKNNFPYIYNRKRSHEEMVEGRIIVNDREDNHFITTGYYDSACRDFMAIPLHYFIMLNIERKLRERKKDFFIYIAECYWGHERFLARSGIVPYNSSLYKICENIIHGKTDVREIYHVYDTYFPSALPPGTELLGILGNHDERRALNTFGQRGLRAAVALTIFMSNAILDYEGSAEGEGWKVFLDNIYVNWNQFEYASHRSLVGFYEKWYKFHRANRGSSYLVWANNNMVAASMKFSGNGIWIGIFNFAEDNQSISLQFDNPALPISDESYYRIVDPLYSSITGHYGYFTGKELKVSRINTVVSYTERIKLLNLESLERIEDQYREFLKDSFFRLSSISKEAGFLSNFSFLEIASRISDFGRLRDFLSEFLIPLFWDNHRYFLELGLKRAFFYLFYHGISDVTTLIEYMSRLSDESDEKLSGLGRSLLLHNEKGPLVFMSAEAEPFSKSGGLANVVYELPRELVKRGEEVYVITGLYRHGDEKSVQKMRSAIQKYGVRYTGRNVRFKILDAEYEVGIHYGEVEGIKYFLLDHYEFFDGLYWGITAQEKLRKRVAFARACADVIVSFGLKPHFTFTNDAFVGIFNGIVRSDPVYCNNGNFFRTTFLHIIHNGGWQYFDAYYRYENSFDHFELFNLSSWRAPDFSDPVFQNRINCMAAGIRFADRTITVSPSYARQIEYACDGLEVLLDNVIGISNAIGENFKVRIMNQFNQRGFHQRYYPELLEIAGNDSGIREKIASKYPEILEGSEKVYGIESNSRRYVVARALNKMLLQIQRGLAVDPDKMLLVMIHRITEQKGFQLILDSSEGIFKKLGLQAIMGGAVSSGDKRGDELAHGLYLLGEYYPDSVSVTFGFQDVSIPLLSSDLFCMPSMNEPGGISQLEALACGCFIIARATGGLRDTVFPLRVLNGEVEGNGFLFSDYSAWAFYDAVERAHNFLLGNGDEMIYRARINAERSVYYWDMSARKYIEEIYKIKEMVVS